MAKKHALYHVCRTWQRFSRVHFGARLVSALTIKSFFNSSRTYVNFTETANDNKGVTILRNEQHRHLHSANHCSSIFFAHLWRLDISEAISWKALSVVRLKQVGHRAGRVVCIDGIVVTWRTTSSRPATDYKPYRVYGARIDCLQSGIDTTSDSVSRPPVRTVSTQLLRRKQIRRNFHAISVYCTLSSS